MSNVSQEVKQNHRALARDVESLAWQKRGCIYTAIPKRIKYVVVALNGNEVQEGKAVPTLLLAGKFYQTEIGIARLTWSVHRWFHLVQVSAISLARELSAQDLQAIRSKLEQL